MAIHRMPKEDDPHPMLAKFDSHCSECEGDINEGDKVVWDPKNRKIYCEECGKEILS